MIKLHVRKPFLFVAVLAAVVAMVLFSFSFATNPEGDYDNDGLYFEDDNCPYIYNPMQMDRDGDGIGDVCEDEGRIVYPKKEEMVICYFEDLGEPIPDDDGPQDANCETIVVNGNVVFDGIGSEGDYVYFDIYTDEGQPLTGGSAMFGNIELELGGEGYYQEKFNGLDFPADAEITYYNWVLWVDAIATCTLVHDQEICESELEPGSKFPMYLNNPKYETGIIKAFPPLYENPLCTNLPGPFDGGFSPMMLGGEFPFPFSGEFDLFYNCDEFGTPVLNQPATPDIFSFLSATANPFIDLNTDVEVRILKGQDIDEYRLTGLSDITYTPSTNNDLGSPLDTIESELVALDLIGTSPLQIERVGFENAEIRMRLLNENDAIWEYLEEPNPYLPGRNGGIEFYLLDIFSFIYNDYWGGPSYLDFFSETMPMVGVMEAYVAFEADLDGDGDVDTIVPLEIGEGPIVKPVLLGAYPGKKGVPPYYTTYCTLNNSHILQTLKYPFGEYFDWLIPDQIDLYRVMTNGELTQPHYSGILDLMCFEVRENEVCDNVDNDLDGLVDEGPYNWVPGEEDDDDWEVINTYDFEDEAYGNGSADDYAYHSYQYNSPPPYNPWSMGDSEFNHNNVVCEQQQPATFYIYVDGKEVGQKHYQHYLETGEFDLSDSLPDSNGNYEVKIVHVGDHAAHIDAVSLGGNAPLNAPAELTKADNDVLSVGGQELVLEFPETNDKTLILVAREETEQSLDSNVAILLPGSGDQYYTHYLGDKSEFKAFLNPTSGHPEGAVYGNVSNDDDYLYIDLDITPDNTDDSGADYVTVTINGSDKEYKVSDTDNTYGELSFTNSENVEYKHKVANVMIPLSEVPKLVEFKVEIYGTLSASEEHYCQIAYSDGPDQNYPNDYRYWAMTDDSYSWNYNTQRFEFYVNDDVEEGDMLRVHWEGRALQSNDTARVYVWNTSTESWESLGFHSSDYDNVIEAFVNPVDHIDEGGYVNVVVQGDIYEELDHPQLVYADDLKATILADDDDEGPYYYSETLVTDYVKLELLAPREGCVEQGPRRNRGGGGEPSGGGDPDPTPKPAAEEAPAVEACLGYNEGRSVNYANNTGWAAPYVDTLSKFYVLSTGDHIISGDGGDPKDTENTSFEDFRAYQTNPGALRWEALSIAMKSFCITPYADAVERSAFAGEKPDFSDASRSPNNLVSEDVLNTIYKAYDLGLFDGRANDQGGVDSAWDQKIYRVEALALFMRTADMGGLLDKYNDITLEELEAMVEEHFSDVDPTAWYAKYIPFVIETRLIAERPDMKAFPFGYLTRGEDVALSTRMIYITSILDHVNPASGHNLLNEDIHNTIQTLLTDAERAEFLFGEFLVGLKELVAELG